MKGRAESFSHANSNYWPFVCDFYENSFKRVCFASSRVAFLDQNNFLKLAMLVPHAYSKKKTKQINLKSISNNPQTREV